MADILNNNQKMAPPCDCFIEEQFSEEMQDKLKLDSNNMDSKSQVSSASLVRPDLTGYCPASNLALNEIVHKLKKQGRQIHHLAFGQSPFPVVPCAVEALREFVTENAYLPVAGLAELRQGITKFHLRHDDLDLDPDDIIVAPGSKELIFLLFKVFNGDILTISPTWTTYKPQGILAGHTPYVVETKMEDDWRLMPEAIEKVVRENNLKPNRLLIMCNPDNPTGTSYKGFQLKNLSATLKKHNILVLSDEIYARLKFDGKHETLAKYYPEGTIISTGLSKWASAGGWRLGYHIYPKELHALKSAVKSAASHSYSCAPAPMQYAAAKMFNNVEACDSYISHTCRILEAVAKFTHGELTSVGVKVVMPSGSYYMFPDFEVVRPALKKRNIKTCDEMCKVLMEEAGVALMAGGPAFLRPAEELTTRLCFVCFDGSVALKQSIALGIDEPLPEDFVKEWCNGIYEAVLALKNWVVKMKEE